MNSPLVGAFRGGDGRTAACPLAVSGPAPGVDLDAVGLLLAPPALTGEFCPVSLWRGVERLPVRPVSPAAHPGGLRAAFMASVRELTDGVETIGVAVSGGLDSLATLVHACRVADGRRVLAFTIEMTDDEGRSSTQVVRSLLRDLSLDHVRLEVITDRDRTAAPWSAVGPRRDALPELNAAVARRAAELGAGVLLSGDGADELLGVPRYATGAVARRHGVRAAARYAADVARSGPGLSGEAVAAGAHLLRPERRAGVYWAVNWPEWAAPVATPVLAEPYRARATAWARAWVADRIAEHAQSGRSWAEADAHDAFYPHDLLPAAGDVREASPYLTETFLSAALAVPLADRYGPRLPTAYWRCKAQVLNLMPRRALRVLPRRKQYYTRTLRRAAATGTRSPLLAAEAGLIDPGPLAAEHDPSVLLAVAAVEQWLQGAVERGFTLT